MKVPFSIDTFNRHFIEWFIYKYPTCSLFKPEDDYPVEIRVKGIILCEPKEFEISVDIFLDRMYKEDYLDYAHINKLVHGRLSNSVRLLFRATRCWVSLRDWRVEYLQDTIRLSNNMSVTSIMCAINTNRLDTQEY